MSERDPIQQLSRPPRHRGTSHGTTTAKVLLVERARETEKTQSGVVILAGQSGTTATVRCRVAPADAEGSTVAVLAYRE
ncbi:hypothetical protein [Haloarchaeobius sp. DT45]|uniref:hypothetical protein n=1 Tax=Haloarchaeobius sp. DT45 TaxID=3446116 RepID=UPI003F6A653B